MISKYKEIIKYLLFGVLTTIVNLLTYYILIYTILNPENTIELQISNIIAWFISVLFAYITNKIYVFESKTNKTLHEILKFFSSRLTTLFLDMALMFIFVSLLSYNDKIIKLIVAIIIIILNYIISKLYVFKKKA